MVKVDIAIKTIDRSPKKNYLGETLRNLERAKVFESENLGKFYIVDGGTQEVGHYFKREKVEQIGHQVHTDHGVRTMHQNAQRCIQLASSGTSDFALVLEDDIDVCGDFLGSVTRWLEEHELHGPQMYVFGSNYQQIDYCLSRGETSWAYPAGSFYGALACGWRREVAADIAEWLGSDPFYLNRSGEEIRDRGHDLKLGQWGLEHGIHYFLSAVPNFIQHIGNESSLGTKPVTYSAFAGHDWSYA